MHPKNFRALWIEETPGGVTRRVIERSVQDLPDGPVLVRVRFSSLNYKDALSASGNRGVTRRYPHTPGIDAAGVVVESADPAFSLGDEVIAAATGEQGVSQPGGFGQYVRLQADWLTHLPAGLSLRDAMGYGTAGLTAALCVDKLRQAGVQPADGEILVTGATGGVGTMACAILARLGFTVVAASGKPDQAGLLRSLGAAQILTRDEASDTSGKPLLPGRWAGVVDTVGGNYLSTAIRSTQPNGIVTCCGNAASAELPLTAFPFILRGVSLLGADASRLSAETRENLWTHLANDWRVDQLRHLVHEVNLNQLDPEIEKILRGGQVGRTLVILD